MKIRTLVERRINDPFERLVDVIPAGSVLTSQEFYLEEMYGDGKLKGVSVLGHPVTPLFFRVGQYEKIED